mgnify:CR=1 FL=1
MTAVANIKSNYEDGYAPVLVRKETKEKLKAFRKTLDDRDLNQERRLVTAALEYCLSNEAVLKEVLRNVPNVVIADLETRYEV